MESFKNINSVSDIFNSTEPLPKEEMAEIDIDYINEADINKGIIDYIKRANQDAILASNLVNDLEDLINLEVTLMKLKNVKQNQFINRLELSKSPLLNNKQLAETFFYAILVTSQSVLKQTNRTEAFKEYLKGIVDKNNISIVLRAEFDNWFNRCALLAKLFVELFFYQDTVYGYQQVGMINDEQIKMVLQDAKENKEYIKHAVFLSLARAEDIKRDLINIDNNKNNDSVNTEK